MIISAMYDDSSIEIEGTAGALRKLSLEIEGCDGTCRIVLPKFAEGNERGLSFADALTIIVDSGQVNFTQSERQIVISGSKEKLMILAQNINWLADKTKADTPTKIADHIHIDYYPDHFFLAEGALPLTVTRREFQM